MPAFKQQGHPWSHRHILFMRTTDEGPSSHWRALRTGSLFLPELCVASSMCLAFLVGYFKHHGQIIQAFNSCEKERIVKRFMWTRVLMVTSVSLCVIMEKWDWWSQILGWNTSRIMWQSNWSCVLVLDITLREDIEFRGRFDFILLIYFEY